MTEDEMVGWCHRLNGHEVRQTRGDGEGQGGLACCSPWGHKRLDMTWQLNNNISNSQFPPMAFLFTTASPNFPFSSIKEFPLLCFNGFTCGSSQLQILNCNS